MLTFYLHLGMSERNYGVYFASVDVVTVIDIVVVDLIVVLPLLFFLVPSRMSLQLRPINIQKTVEGKGIRYRVENSFEDR